MRYVDLSAPLTPQTPVYPGDPAPVIAVEASVAQDGCAMHALSFGTHVGTHIDAPNHMLEGGKTLDAYTPDRFIGPGRLIKVEGEITLELVKAASVQAGEIVLFWTGRSDRYSDPDYFETYPAIPEAVATYLAEQLVKMVGVDTCSVDHEEFVAHRALLKNDVLIIENVVNLQALEGASFTVYALPLNLQVDGAPARVIAQIEKE